MDLPSDRKVAELGRLASSVGQDWATSDHYARAEEPDWLGRFWDEGSPFLRFFRELDVTCVLERACGHGRHAAKFGDQAQTVILVDINIANIEYCRERFKESPKFRFALTNGHSLDSVQDRECSAANSAGVPCGRGTAPLIGNVVRHRHADGPIVVHNGTVPRRTGTNPSCRARATSWLRPSAPCHWPP